MKIMCEHCGDEFTDCQIVYFHGEMYHKTCFESLIAVGHFKCDMFECPLNATKITIGFHVYVYCEKHFKEMQR